MSPHLGFFLNSWNFLVLDVSRTEGLPPQGHTSSMNERGTLGKPPEERLPWLPELGCLVGPARGLHAPPQTPEAQFLGMGIGEELLKVLGRFKYLSS